MRPFLSACAATLLLLIPALPAGAQSPNDADSGWGPDRYGLKAGLTSATVSTNMFSDGIERREGVAGMAFAEWTGAPYFSLLTEVGYTQRGYTKPTETRSREGKPLGIDEQPKRFDYLTVAALARLRYPGAAAEPYVLAGPRGDTFLGGAPDNLLIELYDTFAFGATVGVGVELGAEVLPMPAFLEVRYNADVTNSLSSGPRDMRNRAVDILLGIEL